MTRKEYFIELWSYWLKKLKLPEITIRDDFRYHCHACIESWEDGKRELVINSKKLAKWPMYLITNCVFHEIGHLKHDLPYVTKEEQIQSEYKAERYALTMQKKYYFWDWYDTCLWVQRRMKKKRFQKRWPIHYEAFLKCKEYNYNVKGKKGRRPKRVTVLS